MKVKINDLSVEEKLRLRDEVISEDGQEYWNYLESTNKPIPSCISPNKESFDYWLKVMTEGDPSRAKDLITHLITNSSELIGVDLTDTFNLEKEMVVGRWYGATDGTSNDVITIFKYNGESSNRTGWDIIGNWSLNLTDAYDEFAQLVPYDVLVIAFESESRKRGYKEGVETIHGVIELSNGGDCKSMLFQSEDLSEDHFFYNNIKVYKNGDWNNAPIKRSEEIILSENLQSLIRKISICLN